MSDQEILTQAIEKAIAGGWPIPNIELIDLSEENEDGSYLILFHKKHAKTRDTKNIGTEMDVIFNHDFAKALWGEKEMIAYQYHKTLVSGLNVIRAKEDLIEQGAYYIWQYHLQMMVIDPDPIKYLSANI